MLHTTSSQASKIINSANTYHILEVYYSSGKVIINSLYYRHNKIGLSYSYDFSSGLEQAVAFLSDRGFDILSITSQPAPNSHKYHVIVNQLKSIKR